MPKFTDRFLPPNPKYRRHRASGQAIVTFSGHDYYLGPYGTKASRIEYDRLIAEWLAGGRHLAKPGMIDLSIAELSPLSCGTPRRTTSRTGNLPARSRASNGHSTRSRGSTGGCQ